MFDRAIIPDILAALRDTPVVVLHGPRQAGKTTLARQLADHGRPAAYITLDDASALAAARSDPVSFLSAAAGPLIIDEIQRAPELLLPLKAEVDRDRRPGRFLLTGSANVLLVPKLADALVGRMQLLTLLPLSQGEIAGVRERFVDALFAEKLAPLPPAPRSARATSKADLATRIIRGGYPEAVARKQPDRRREWFTAYLNTLLLRDVRDLANVEGLTDFPRLLTALAGRVGGLLNVSELGRDVGMNHMTAKRYLALLDAAFVMHTAPPWFTNRVKRIVKGPKLYFVDTGVLAHLLDATPASFASDGRVAGALLENFVAMELLKQISWSRTRPSLWHFRDHRDNEVDFVLEARGGRIVGIEVKSSATLDAADFRGLNVLAEAAGDRFHRGIVLYNGVESIPFGKRLHALPVTSLWRLGASPQ